MSSPLSTLGKDKLKELLPQCTEAQQVMFKRMYSHKDLEKPINDIIDELPDDRINLALTQVENTISKNNGF